MTNLYHVVLTRFAVRTIAGSDPPSSTWLRHRCALFERFCLPSVRSQSRQGFEWMLFYDSGISEPWLSVIGGYGAAWPGIVPVAVDRPWDRDVAREAVLRRMPVGTEVLLTSRLDNDDAISVDYVTRLRAAAFDEPRGAVVFDWGFTLAGERVYVQPLLRGPFASMVVDVGSATEAPTVFDYEHEELEGRMPVRHVGWPCAWIQVVHGENLANRPRGVRVPRGMLEKRFPSLQVAAESERIAPLAADMLLSGSRFAAGLLSGERGGKAVRFIRTRITGRQ